MAGDKAQDPSRFMFATTDRLAQIEVHEIDRDLPPWSDDMNMRRRMIVGIDDDPETVEAEDRRHAPV